ncbi:MAG: hypothetical protein HY652_06025 [Acidobacteria bacterium]|nr:hypothetical protein [Acidobacteriota bacterium]
MAKEALVEADIDIGRAVVEALDNAGVKVTAALWFYASERGEWLLVLAMPLVDTGGPRQAYTAIQRELRKVPSVPVIQISAVSPKEPLIKVLRKLVRTGHQISGMRLTGNAIDNVYIEDAYIYRVQ